ncbi:glutamate--cysteine ligase [Sorochytrium milnesiophthora]
MGLLSKGTPLEWADARAYADHVRKHGIVQFLNIYHRFKNTGKKGVLYWGDEVEYLLLEFDDANRNVALALRGFDVMTDLMKEELEALKENRSVPILWRPEYGRFMLEGTPGAPYTLKADELLKVEANMKLRREAAQLLLKPNEFLATVTSFPRLGCLDVPFSSPFVDMNDAPEAGHGGHHVDATRSLFIPDEAINPHPRFRTLTANIRERRGQKVAINMPIFRDTNTPSPFVEQLPESPHYPNPYTTGEAKPDHIYMDAMAFGMGCCCLQLTLQASHIYEARRLYDQLAVLSPILMALSASSPIYRGYLADVDCRWNVISSSVDDRNKCERGEEKRHPAMLPKWDSETQVTADELKTPRRIYKSRYDSISTYIAQHDAHFDQRYNDLNLVVDEKIEQQLLDSGVDASLARHIAHLFIRDPLVVYRELLDQDDRVSNDHFENIQSTNWQTMRFKPPSLTAPELGWRVEFRSMEVQLTDFENAAFAIFVVLLSRVVLCLDLNLYIPISKVDENMQTAHKRDAVLDEKFWFRRNVLESLVKGKKTPNCSPKMSHSRSRSSSPGRSLMDIVQLPPAAVVNGNGNGSTHAADQDSIEVELDDVSDPNVCGCTTFASRSSTPLSVPTSPLLPPTTESNGHTNGTSSPAEWDRMSMDEIINGRPNGGFPGLIPLVENFMETIIIEPQVRAQVDKYLAFIRGRANGSIATTANWMRNFVRTHPEYKHDSAVTHAIAYDLMKACQKVTETHQFVNVAPVRN